MKDISATKSVKRLRVPFALGVLLTVFAILYFRHTWTIAPSADPMAYLVAGQNLAAGKGLAFHDPNNALAGPYFTLWCYTVQRPGEADRYLMYPPGFPLIIALVIKLLPFAWAPFLVTPLLALIGLLATFWLGRALAGDVAGLAAVLLLGLSPLYLRYSVILWSDGPAAVLSVLALALLVTAVVGARPSWLRLILAGLLLGYVAFIRYSSAIIALPMALYIVTLPKTRSERLRIALAALIPFGVALAAILAYNDYMYGGYLITGYSPKQGWYEWPAFSLSYALGVSPVGRQSLIAAARTILSDLPLALPVAVFGLLVVKRQAGVLLGGTILAVAGLYSVYAFPPEGVNARFLLPVFPVVAVAAGVGVQFLLRLEGKAGAPVRLAGLVLMGASIALLVPTPALLDEEQAWARSSIQQIQALTSQSEPNAVFASYYYNDVIRFYGQRSVLFHRRIPRYDQATRRYDYQNYEPCLVQTIDRLLEHGIPVYYLDDKSPEWLNLMSILPRYYAVKAAGGDPPLYRVMRGGETAPQDVRNRELLSTASCGEN
jgi:hypothetical protein